MVGPKPGGGAKIGGVGGGLGDGGFSESINENSMMKALTGAGGRTNSTGGVGGNHRRSTKQGVNPNIGGSSALSDGVPGSISKPQQVEPREVGTISEEVKRGVEDTWKEVKKFFSINTWLGVDPEKIDPEEQAKAKEFHARYQQLDQEQQAVAKQIHQEKMQKKKMQEEEDKRKKEIEAQQKAQSVQMPSSPQKGVAGSSGKSKKSRVMQKLQQDRTTIGTTQGE